jgi:hypothetical protein
VAVLPSDGWLWKVVKSPSSDTGENMLQISPALVLQPASATVMEHLLRVVPWGNVRVLASPALESLQSNESVNICAFRLVLCVWESYLILLSFLIWKIEGILPISWNCEISRAGSRHSGVSLHLCVLFADITSSCRQCCQVAWARASSCFLLGRE